MGRRKQLINGIYLLLWILPLFFFVKDFWDWRELQESWDYSFLQILFFTGKQSLYSSFFSFLLSLFPAIYLAYHRNKISQLLESMLFIPFFFPVISTITIFSIVGNSKVLQPLSLLYTMKAIVIAHVFYNSPIFVKYIGEALRNIPKEIEEAMYLDGASPHTIFWKGKMALMLPQIFKAFILCFSYCFLSFAIVLSLGGVQYQTLEVEIASTLLGNFNFTKAMLYGGVQFVLLLFLNAIGRLLPSYEWKGKAYEKETSSLSCIVSILYILFEYGLVLFSFVLSFYNYFEGNWSLKAYVHLFSKEFQEQYPILIALRNSVVMSALAALLVLVLAYLLLRNYSPLIDIILFANFGISGAFFAISLYYLHVLWEIPLWLLLGLGYILLALPLAYSFLYQRVKDFPKDLEEMARMDNAKGWEMFTHLRFPMLRSFFVSSFLQLFAIFLGEFTLAYTMQLGDLFPVISLVNYQLLVDKKYLESSALSSLLVASIFILFLFGERWKQKGEK